ncbi:MAG: cytochrome c maturation protein CcmE [Bradyrhizobiaceae bacterium]|nr:cytochrome c maturation protein CcmE [Bradyrhizobiaceae bacterium]
MNKRYVIGGIVVVALVLIGWYALDNSAIEYTNVDKAEKLGSTVQIVGTWVKDDGSSYDQNQDIFRFTLKDQNGKSIPVELAGSKPNNFEIAVSLVVKGRVENGVLKAQNVLTKCPSKYEGTPQGA